MGQESYLSNIYQPTTGRGAIWLSGFPLAQEGNLQLSTCHLEAADLVLVLQSKASTQHHERLCVTHQSLLKEHRYEMTDSRSV